ncbi:MAG: hypothetical protein EON93_05050 [Burkholderiales bacterium]|nr:MAG: hypothetical protein EON93_05050 [Burkholderiales bacterium]
MPRILFAAVCAAVLATACSGQASSPQSTDAKLAGPSPDAPQTASNVPPPPADPLAAGSQEAKDDLYCSSLIYLENPDVSDALAPVEEAILRKAQTLGFLIGEAGINKLVTEKAVHATHARIVADAYNAQVAKDMKAKTLRISLDDCNARAAALPMPE